MTVSSQTLAFEYAANGVTTIFAYGFRVLYADQVKVYVNGTLQVGGYALTGVGDAGGGNVVFTVAPVNGSTILVRRISDRVRTTDFQQAPYFTQEELLDIDQDYQTMLLQEAAADSSNALRIPAVETNNVELPAAEDRANKYVGFNISGDVVALAGTGEATDAQMISFTQAGTGAVARTMQNKMREVVSAEDFGAVGDGVTDDSAAIQLALNGRKYVLLTAGKTYLAKNLSAVSRGALMCIGGRATIKIAPGSSAYGLAIQQSDFILDGINIDGGNMGPYNVAAPTSGLRNGLLVGNAFGTGVQLQNITVQNCDIYGCDYAGFYGGEVQIGFVFGKRVTLNNVNCYRNYSNFRFETRFEYTNMTLCYGYEGHIGILVSGGNNKITSSSFENNWNNCELTSGENNSHGGFVNCSFNHSMPGGLGLLTTGAEYGMAFTNCFFWYGPIHLVGSTGIQIRNSEIVNSPIAITGGGVNSIDDNFIRDPIVPTLNGSTFTSFRRNRTNTTDTSFASVYGDVYAQANASALGASPAISTSGTDISLQPQFSIKRYHGVEAAFLQSGDKLYIPRTGMYEVSARVKLNLGAVDDLITLTVARYTGAGVLLEKLPASGFFKASQAGAVVSLSTRLLFSQGELLGILIATGSGTNSTIQDGGIDVRVSSVD